MSGPQSQQPGAPKEDGELTVERGALIFMTSVLGLSGAMAMALGLSTVLQAFPIWWLVNFMPGPTREDSLRHFEERFVQLLVREEEEEPEPPPPPEPEPEPVLQPEPEPVPEPEPEPEEEEEEPEPEPEPEEDEPPREDPLPTDDHLDVEAIGASEDGTAPAVERGTRQVGERAQRRRTRQAREEEEERAQRAPERRRPVRIEETHIQPQLAGVLGIDFPNFDYPREFREAAIAGLVVVQCIITERGDVRGCRIRSGPEPLGEYVISVVQQWRYEPGRDHNNETVAVAQTYRVPFRLN